MRKLIREVLECVGIGLIAPTITSLLFCIPGEAGWILGGACGFILSLESAASGNESSASGKEVLFSLGWGVWVTASTPLALFSHYSISHTTLLVSSIVYGALALDEGAKQLQGWLGSKTEKLLAEEQAKREKFEVGVMKLVGDDKLARGFLLALGRLTEYVPEEGNRLLQAVITDLERFTLLESIVLTTSNDVLRVEAEKECGQIATEARKLCAELTQEALEAIRVHQSIESERTLGNDGAPLLVEARRDFRRYLDGLKEVRDLTPGSQSDERALREKFKQLEPSHEVRELPATRTARSRGKRK